MVCGPGGLIRGPRFMTGHHQFRNRIFVVSDPATMPPHRHGLPLIWAVTEPETHRAGGDHDHPPTIHERHSGLVVHDLLGHPIVSLASTFGPHPCDFSCVATFQIGDVLIGDWLTTCVMAPTRPGTPPRSAR